MLSIPSMPALLPWLILPAFLLLCLGLGWGVAGRLGRLAAASLLERLFFYWLLGIVAVSWIGTVLAGFGLFRPWLLVALLLLLIGAARWQQHRSGLSSMDSVQALQPEPRLIQGLVVVLLILAAWIFARPAESFFLFDDSSVYTIGGVLLARTGSLLAHQDSFWQSTQALMRQLYTVDPFGLIARYYGPFYEWLPDSQTMEIGFLPLTKVWIALSTWLSNPGYAAWATPFFGVTGLALLYALVRRLLGWPSALGAVLLLGSSLPQIWFARYPISEIYTQVFWLGGLYLAVLARQNAARRLLSQHLAFWSALTLAALVVLRFEGGLLLLAAAAILLLSWARVPEAWQRFGRTWTLTLVMAGLFGVALSAGIARHYFFAQTLGTLTPTRVQAAILGLLGLCLGGAWLLARRENFGLLLSRLKRLAPWVPRGLAAGWLVWLLIATGQILLHGLSRDLAGWLVQYWTVPSLVLGVAGAAWLLWQQARRGTQPELTVLLGLAIVLLLGYAMLPFVAPLHPWAMRRLVPMVFPALACSIAGLLTAPSGYLGKQPVSKGLSKAWYRVAAVLGIGVLLIQVLALGRISYPLLWHEELRGYWQQLQAAAGSLPQGAVLLFGSGDDGAHVMQALDLLFGHPSFTLSQDLAAATPPELNEVIKNAYAQGRRVFLVQTGDHLHWYPADYQLVGVGEHNIQTTILRPASGRPPEANDIVPRTFRFDIYEVLPKTASSDTMAVTNTPLAFSAGAGGYPYLRAGFYGWDMGANGQIARWTDGNGLMIVPWPDSDRTSPASFCLNLKVAGGRPESESSVKLQVVAEDRPIFEQTLNRSFEPEQLFIPVEALANHNQPQLEIRLDSTTWQPEGNGEGSRHLGVLFYGLQLLRIEECKGHTS
jgi:hypothetical protein